MRAAATPRAHLASLLATGAEQGALALAGLVGGEARPGPLFEPEPGRVAGYPTGVAFEVGGALEGRVAILFTAPLGDRLLDALGRAAAADPASALAEVANIVASQAVSAIADRLGSRVTLSVPRLEEGSGGSALAAALRAGAAALASEVGGGGALLVFLPGGAARAAIP